MKNKFKVLQFIPLVFFLALVFLIPVRADLSTSQINCPSGSISEACVAPTIADAQLLAVNLVGMAYGAGGLLFLAILVYNGLIYLLGSWEEAKYILGASLEDIQKRMAQWGIGFLIFFLSYPIMNSILHFVVSDSICYKDMQNPVVMFIFPTVCQYTTYVDAKPVPVTPTAPGPTVVTQMSCGQYVAAYPSKDHTVAKMNLFCMSSCGSVSKGFKEFAATSVYEEIGYIQCNCQPPFSTCFGVR